jgi:tRNA (guanine-N(7)-)-methyltransferase subunit TRM82
MHIPPCHPHLLVSGGGDRTLRVWDYLSGRQLAALDIWEVVQPFLKAQSRRRKFKREENWAGKGWRARRRAERERKEKEAQQRKQGEEISPARSESPHVSMAIDSVEREEAEGSPIAQEGTTVPAIGVAENTKPAVEDVVVISRIVTLQESDGFTIVFSVLG